MKKRRLFYIILSLFVFYSFFLIPNLWSYKISNDIPTIEISIEEWLNKQSSDNHMKITILKNRDLENYKLILFKDQYSRLGEAVLKKGINRKYKLESVGIGTNLIRYKTLKTNNGTYFWVMGRNNEGIKAMTAYFYNYSNKNEEPYTIIIPQEQYFIEYGKVSDNIDSTYPQKIEIVNDL